MGLERDVILGCPGISQDWLGHVGLYCGIYLGMSWDIPGWGGTFLGDMQDVVYISGCHGISRDGLGHVGLVTLLWCISQDVPGGDILGCRGMSWDRL